MTGEWKLLSYVYLWGSGGTYIQQTGTYTENSDTYIGKYICCKHEYDSAKSRQVWKYFPPSPLLLLLHPSWSEWSEYCLDPIRCSAFTTLGSRTHGRHQHLLILKGYFESPALVTSVWVDYFLQGVSCISWAGNKNLLMPNQLLSMITHYCWHIFTHWTFKISLWLIYEESIVQYSYRFWGTHETS
jgi:hypothetical protein